MKQPTNQILFPEPTKHEEPTIARLMRIADGLEMLERMVLGEKDPVRQDALYVVLAEAKCIG